MALIAVRPPEAERQTRVVTSPPIPETGSSRRYARRALWLVLLALIVSQPLSIPLAYYAIGKFIAAVPEFAGMDVHTQWQAYLARPKAPDVLFIGDSQTFTDLNPDAIASGLSSTLGHPVSVAKFGVPGEGPAFLDALMYRLMHQRSRPRLIVFELQQYTFNANRRWDPTADLWELSNPPDPGFMALAMRVDPGRWRLLRAWLIPYFITYQPISQLAQCSVFEMAQTVAVLLGRVPLELRHQAACKSGDAYLQVNRYQDDPNYRYSVREEDFVREAVAMARAGGSRVMFGEYPFVGLETSNPAAHRSFQSRAETLAASLGVPMFDLASAFTDEHSARDRSLWLDLAHMAPGGARAIAPEISQLVAEVLS